MTCRELIEFLWKYVEGELSESQRATFDAHLAVCPECVQYLESYRETARLCGEAFAGSAAEIPTNVPQEFVRAILDARSK